MESMDFPRARCKRICSSVQVASNLATRFAELITFTPKLRIRSMVPASAVDTVKIMLFGENCMATAGKPESSSRSLSNESLPGRINLFVTGHCIEVVRLDSVHQLHRLALGWNQIEPAPGEHQRFRQSKDPVRNRVPMMVIIEKPRGESGDPLTQPEFLRSCSFRLVERRSQSVSQMVIHVIPPQLLNKV
jgi:hypothetical protein